jgi:hypothetical protein
MKMGFGDIFSRSFEEYKKNFKSIFLLLLVFVGIFSILSFLVTMMWVIHSDVIRDFLMGKDIFENFEIDSLGIFALYFLTNIIVVIAGILVYLFVQASIISSSLRKEKYRYSELVASGKKFYGTYLSYSVVITFFLIGLFLLLIIPGIIFLIYWIFSSYVLYDEKKGIRAALKRSREIVKGRWWMVFGYTLLFFIIMFLIQGIISMIVAPTQFIYFLKDAPGTPLSTEFFLLNMVLGTLANFFSYLISIPLSILFYKNLYLEMKREMKDAKKK